MFKYNSTSQVALYIQHLLRTTALPGCPTANPFNKAALAQGALSTTTHLNGNHFCRNGCTSREWSFGELIPNLTSTYSSSETHYSAEVHERLGDYLRVYRDYYGIDLMNFYNCYSGREVGTIGLPITNSTAVGSTLWYKSSNRGSAQVTCFPIKVGAKYLIKIYNSNHKDIILQPAFAVGGKLLEVLVTGKDSDGNEITEPKVFKDSRAASSQFTFDASASLFEDNLDLWSKQRYLNLFIQVDTPDPLRISVIEQTGYPTAQFNSLLDLDNIDYNVPFSDRLLEYLTGNVITSVDSIPQNIERIQAIVASEDFGRYGTPKSCLPKGRYTEELRRCLYQAFSSYRDINGEPLKDFLGYVDKDVEKLLWDCLSEHTRKAVLEI